MQVQNNKEEVPFAHYEEKFASLDPQEAAARCGVPFENGRFTAETKSQGLFHQIQKEVTFCGLLHGAYA